MPSRGYPVVDIKGPGFNLLGDHFSPVVALFAPLWALCPSPVTLLVAQAVLLAVSVAVVLADRRSAHLGVPAVSPSGWRTGCRSASSRRRLRLPRGGVRGAAAGAGREWRT